MLELNDGQSYLENEVRISRRGNQFVVSPGFHGGIKLVVGAIWLAVVGRFLIVRFISTGIGDKDLLRGEDLCRIGAGGVVFSAARR